MGVGKTSAGRPNGDGRKGIDNYRKLSERKSYVITHKYQLSKGRWGYKEGRQGKLNRLKRGKTFRVVQGEGRENLQHAPNFKKLLSRQRRGDNSGIIRSREERVITQKGEGKILSKETEVRIHKGKGWVQLDLNLCLYSKGGIEQNIRKTGVPFGKIRPQEIPWATERKGKSGNHPR